jgi:hypothetical protein
VRKFTLIFIIVCLAGCSETYNIEDNSTADTIYLDSCTGVAAYLKGRNLPDLKSVRVWKNEYGPGLKLTTAHYEIYTTLLKLSLLERISEFIESSYRAYNSLLPKPVETRTKFTIYLLANRSQWEHFTKKFTGEQAEMFCKIKAGAYYHNDACVLYNIGIKRTLAAIGHEGWHQFNGRHFKFRMPSWLDEGTAMLFETYGMENGMIYFDPAENKYRIDALRKTFAKNKKISLRELISMNPGDVLATDATESVMAFYSQSYALVRFLREADYGKRLGVYQKLLADGLEGTWALNSTSKRIATDRNTPKTAQWNRIVGRRLFEEYIGYNTEQIEREYLVFCKQITGTQD